jgi:hypothetical protein
LLFFGCILTLECGNHLATDAFYSQISSSSSFPPHRTCSAFSGGAAAASQFFLSFFLGFCLFCIRHQFFCSRRLSGSGPTNIINKANIKTSRVGKSQWCCILKRGCVCLSIIHTMCVQPVCVSFRHVFQR